MAKSIVGVDIGDDSIRAVEVKDPSKPHPVVTRFHQLPLPEGAVRAGEVLEPNTVAAVLKKLWSTGGFKTRNIVLGMGNQRVFARDITLPYAPLEQIRESLPFQVQEHVPMPVSEAVLDFYPVSEVMVDGVRSINGLLIAATKESVLANISAATIAGLAVMDVDLIPFAITRVHRAAGISNGTLAAVDVGSFMTNVVIARNGVPEFVRIIAGGGNEVNEALVNRLSMAPATAELAKRKLGMEPTNLAEAAPASAIITEVSGELITGIRKTLDFYTAAQPGRSIDRIAITGGGARLRGFTNALTELTRVPVVAGNLRDAATLASKLSRIDGDHAQSMMVGLGLAMGHGK
jgi:type IV pilus assembly protein PilM